MRSLADELRSKWMIALFSMSDGVDDDCYLCGSADDPGDECTRFFDYKGFI